MSGELAKCRALQNQEVPPYRAAACGQQPAVRCRQCATIAPAWPCVRLPCLHAPAAGWKCASPLMRGCAITPVAPPAPLTSRPRSTRGGCRRGKAESRPAASGPGRRRSSPCCPPSRFDTAPQRSGTSQCPAARHHRSVLAALQPFGCDQERNAAVQQLLPARVPPPAIISVHLHRPGECEDPNWILPSINSAVGVVALHSEAKAWPLTRDLRAPCVAGHWAGVLRTQGLVVAAGPAAERRAPWNAAGTG